MTAPIVAHSFDPYHGDLNNRHPRLGAPVKRVVEREQWNDFRLTQPAIYGNGVYGYPAVLDTVELMDRARHKKITVSEKDSTKNEVAVWDHDTEAVAMAQQLQKEAA